jgi:membrane protease YdiL (CAAX protease family)
MSLSPSAKALVLSLLLTGSLWLFALFIQTNFPLRGVALIGLLLSAYLVKTILLQNPEVYLGQALWQWRRASYVVIILSLVAALLLSIYYRTSIQMPWFPAHLGPFVLVSVLIGCSEEIIFRGFVQGEASRWHKEGAVVFGALSHAGYKSLLFVLPVQLIDMSIQHLFLMTFLAGLVLGFTRYRSGSIWPSLLAHGLFDFWVYAELSTAPWWVW